MLHVIQEIPLTKTLLEKMKINRKNKKSSLNEHADSIYEETKTIMQKEMDEKKKDLQVYGWNQTRIADSLWRSS